MHHLPVVSSGHSPGAVDNSPDAGSLTTFNTVPLSIPIPVDDQVGEDASVYHPNNPFYLTFPVANPPVTPAIPPIPEPNTLWTGSLLAAILGVGVVFGRRHLPSA